MRCRGWATRAGCVCAAVVLVAGCSSTAHDSQADTANELRSIVAAEALSTHKGDFGPSYDVLDACCKARWTRAAWIANLSAAVAFWRAHNAKAKLAGLPTVEIDATGPVKVLHFKPTAAEVLVTPNLARGGAGEGFAPPSLSAWTYEHGAWVTNVCIKL